MAPDRPDLEGLTPGNGWHPLAASAAVVPWSDDYANVLGAPPSGLRSSRHRARRRQG
jgi:hypothetical protein